MADLDRIVEELNASSAARERRAAASPSGDHRLIDLLKEALPGARDEDLYWAYHNLSGALTLTLGETGRLDRLSEGLCRSGDLKTAYATMTRFAAAGFRAVCARA